MNKQIYIKLEKPEAIDINREILMAEMNLIKNIKILKRYVELRKGELILKLKLNKQIKETSIELKKVMKNVPRIETPEKEEAEKDKSYKAKKDKSEDYDLERQLQEIQAKLKALK